MLNRKIIFCILALHCGRVGLLRTGAARATQGPKEGPSITDHAGDAGLGRSAGTTMMRSCSNFTGKKGNEMRRSSPRRGAGEERRRRRGRGVNSARGGGVVFGAVARAAVVRVAKAEHNETSVNAT